MGATKSQKEPSPNRHLKHQSAMEYLMTYGWAILIIAVVLGAIYSLGLFNGVTLAPRAQPGSCQVYRPNGPFTIAYVSLVGACTNQLPKYVANFYGVSHVSSSQVVIPSVASLQLTGNITITAWVNTNGYQGRNTVLSKNPYQEFDFLLDGCSSSGCILNFYEGNVVSTTALGTASPVVKTFTWTFVTVVRKVSAGTSNVMFYSNGKSVGNYTTTQQIAANTLPVQIGERPSYGGEEYNGSMANVQLYNTTLDSNSIYALYREGIGGAPIQLQNLVGWWPLNENGNDYSGNLNNGQAQNIRYTSDWLSGYTVP